MYGIACLGLSYINLGLNGVPNLTNKTNDLMVNHMANLGYSLDIKK